MSNLDHSQNVKHTLRICFDCFRKNKTIFCHQKPGIVLPWSWRSFWIHQRSRSNILILRRPMNKRSRSSESFFTLNQCKLTIRHSPCSETPALWSPNIKNRSLNVVVHPSCIKYHGSSVFLILNVVTTPYSLISIDVLRTKILTTLCYQKACRIHRISIVTWIWGRFLASGIALNRGFQTRQSHFSAFVLTVINGPVIRVRGLIKYR